MANNFYEFGRKAGSTYRRAKWIWQSVAGSEADAIRAEQDVGRDMAVVVKEQTAVVSDNESQLLIDELTRRLAGVVRNDRYDFEVKVVINEEATAFALPGGFIFIAQQLVELCNSDPDEVAFVVAHEMSHVIRRHAIDRLVSQKVLSAAALASPGRGVLAPWMRRVGLQWLERAYSQDQEFEADELGMLLVRAAGFDPRGSLRMLNRLQQIKADVDQNSPGAYLSTHPPVSERVHRLREQYDKGRSESSLRD